MPDWDADSQYGYRVKVTVPAGEGNQDVVLVCRPEVLERAAGTDEFVEHAIECTERDRKVTFTFFQMRRSAWELGGKPLGVGEWHHQVSATLPEHGRHRDLLQPKAPRSGEGDVVLKPPLHARAHGLAEVGGHI